MRPSQDGHSPDRRHKRKHYPKILADFLKTVSVNNILGKQLLENSIVNPRGIPGHGVAVDQYLEHQILEIKKFLKAGQSMSTVKEVTLMLPILACMKATAKEDLNMSSSSSHTKPDRDGDVKKAVQVLLKDLLAGAAPEKWENPYEVAGAKIHSKGGALAEEWDEVGEEEIEVGRVSDDDDPGI